MTDPLLTCEAVLAETAFHLQSVPLVLGLVREGLITVAFDCNDHLAQLEALAVRYADRHPDLDRAERASGLWSVLVAKNRRKSLHFLATTKQLTNEL